MELAANALTTLESAREYLQIPDGVIKHDDAIKRMINAASEAIENHCDRKFAKATFTEWYKGNNRVWLRLYQWPIVSITSVSVNGSAYTEGEGEDNDYILDDEGKKSGMLYCPDGWPAKQYYGGLTYDPIGTKRNIKVTYEAGYILPKDEDLQASPPVVRSLPYDLEQACLLLVQYYYKTDIANFSTVFGEGGQVFRPSKIPPHVVVLLEKYKRKD